MAVNPEIKKLTEKIRHTGPADQVRESIAGGMDLTSEEASATRDLADQTENRQTKVESDFKTLQQEYTENGNGTQTTAEISLARDGEPVLADRLNRDFGNITAQFQQTELKKADVTYVDQTVSRMSGGAIKGTYTTLAALKSAYPSGAVGPFMIEETGNRYIWDVNKNDWVNIGPYEPAEIGKGDITTEKYADNSLTPQKTTFLKRTDKNILRIAEMNSTTFNGLTYGVTNGELFVFGTPTSGTEVIFPLVDKITIPTNMNLFIRSKYKERNEGSVSVTRNFRNNSNETITSISGENELLTVASSATQREITKIRIYFNPNQLYGARFQMNANFGQSLNEYEDYYTYYNKDIVLLPSDIRGLTTEIDKAVNKPLNGKSIVFIGDSTTDTKVHVARKFHVMLSEDLGCTSLDCGKSGTGFKRTEESGTAFYQRALNIPSNSDLVFIFGGGNDCSQPYVKGSVSDIGTDTLSGAINKTIDNVLAIAPLARIVLVTPYPWQQYPPHEPENKMAELSNQMIEIAKYRGIKSLDLYHESSLRPWDTTFNYTYFHNSDGVHLKETGHKMIYPAFKQTALSMMDKLS